MVECSSSNRDGKPLVVILGGQFAGRRVKQLLNNAQFDVVVVDAKGFFEYTPSVLRCMVQPSYIPTITSAHPSDFILARAVEIQPGSKGQRGTVVLSNGDQLKYDYLVIATGSSYASPIKAKAHHTPAHKGGLDARRKALQDAASHLQEAHSVVIIGGGTVGVELAAEVAGAFPGTKNVTLITSQKRLLDRMPRAAQDYAERWLLQHGVDVVTNERVVTEVLAETPPSSSEQLHSSGSGNKLAAEGGDGADGKEQRAPMPVQRIVVTNAGRSVEADIVYRCIGNGRYEMDLFKPLLGEEPEVLERAAKRGIPVTKTLQMEGHPNVLVCGDAMQSDVEKTAYVADISAAVVAHNLERLVSGQPLVSFPEGALATSGRQQLPVMEVVSLYKWDGVMVYNELVLPGKLAAATKAMIEFIQLRVAAGTWGFRGSWLVVERVLTWAGQYLFTTGGGWFGATAAHTPKMTTPRRRRMMERAPWE